VLTDGVLLRVC